MLSLLTADQLRKADAHTIENEPIASVDLMERAAKAFTGWFVNSFADRDVAISVYCGTGNNGGDGLAIARMLFLHGYQQINVKIARFTDKNSGDFNTNFSRIQESEVPWVEIRPGEGFPPEDSHIIIDALLGTGLNKPLAGDFERLVRHINSLEKTVVAVDVPTGMPTEGEFDKNSTIIKADLLITFQQPKINYLLPESGPYIKSCKVVNIGLDEEYINSLGSVFQYVEEKDIRKILRPRQRFSNKGTYGHALVVAGQAKTMGAALICAASCAYAGAGLTTACVPESGLTALNSYMPELMAVIRQGNNTPEIEYEKFTAIGIGPGLGKDENALGLFTDILTSYGKPMVIDADGLNLLSMHRELWRQVPAGSILTPHMKEFDRLFGDHDNWWQRLQTALNKARDCNIYIVLKNDYTVTATPQGRLYFNSTSNAAMATGGMGDALTGIITALLAQKYSAEEACLAGVYIHGKAGDELALPNRMMTLMPGKLAEQLPITMARLLA
jgi:NAD(P)H-hydrate epimerase